MNSINVLSLFDGISCGQIALERSGININNYFASEIDQTAIKITQKNYPNTIQVGDITKLRKKILPQIDLLIGGSPCQGFSSMGNHLNFEDKRSYLFFEYVRILKELNPKYFLLENVHMKKEWIAIISNHLQTLPIEINGDLLSASRRRRLFWSNIPNLTQPKDKLITFDDINTNNQDWIDPETIKRMAKWMKPVLKATTINNKEKLYCLLTKYNSCTSSAILIKHETKNKYRHLTPVEAAMALTIPINHVTGVSKIQYGLLFGNAWTVDVVVHMLNQLKTVLI